MILTPEQIEGVNRPGYVVPNVGWGDVADTLAAYAEVVQRVAEMRDGQSDWEEDHCVFCGAYMPRHGHATDCLYLAARKLRGT